MVTNLTERDTKRAHDNGAKPDTKAVEKAGKPEPRIELVKLKDLDRSLQIRKKLDKNAIKDYAALIGEGVEFDPGIAYTQEDGKLALVAGHHRWEAHKRAGKDSMRVEIRKGHLGFALRRAIEDNDKHIGVRMTQADRRNAVDMMLRAYPNWGDESIAKAAGVSRSTVIRRRRHLEKVGEISSPSERIGADGRKINVRQIGKTAAKEQEATCSNATSEGEEAPGNNQNQRQEAVGGRTSGKSSTSANSGQSADTQSEKPASNAAYEAAPKSKSGEVPEKAAAPSNDVDESAHHEEAGTDQQTTRDRAQTILVNLMGQAQGIERGMKELHGFCPGPFNEAYGGLRTMTGALAQWST